MSVELSHKNHFRFGYDGKPFTFRRSSGDRWWVRYGRCEREVGAWREECVRTAQLLRESTSLPICVLLSGGIDSEVALSSFLAAGIPVSAAILRFKNDLNVHDISHAVIFCEQNGVPYRFLDLDIVDFFESGVAFEYADATQCRSPQFLAPMWCIDQIDGYPVMGSGECYLVKRSEYSQIWRVKAEDFSPAEELEGDDSSWDLWEKEMVASWYRHLLARGRAGCAGFFQFNPENILAFLRDPLVAALARNEMEGKISSMTSKFSICASHFPLNPRPKYTGYEKLGDLDRKYRPLLEAKFRHHGGIYRTPYSKLLRDLAPRESGAPAPCTA